MKLVYIASLSHSGSTLLDVLLNAHSKIVSVGELKQLRRRLNPVREKRSFHCTCGARTIEECVFWSDVDGRLFAAHNLHVKDIKTDAYGKAADFASNGALLHAIAEAAGVEYVVDSSKERRRLSSLRALEGIDLFPILLVRDPKGQICSALRKVRGSTFEEIAKYNLMTTLLMRGMTDKPYHFLRYEDLAQNPEKELSALLAKLGLSFEPGQLDWASTPRHSWAGNRMRYGGSTDIVLDEKWRSRLSPFQKAAIDIGTMPSRAMIAREERRLHLPIATGDSSAA